MKINPRHCLLSSVLVLLCTTIPHASAQESMDDQLSRAQAELSTGQEKLESILENKKESACLNLRNCKVDVSENETIRTYFQDDLELALDGLSL